MCRVKSRRYVSVLNTDDVKYMVMCHICIYTVDSLVLICLKNTNWRNYTLETFIVYEICGGFSAAHTFLCFITGGKWNDNKCERNRPFVCAKDL